MDPTEREWFPDMDDNGVGLCSEECKQFDGKRCELMGFRPGRICEPWAIDVVAKLKRMFEAAALDEKVATLHETEHLGHADLGVRTAVLSTTDHRTERIAVASRVLAAFIAQGETLFPSNKFDEVDELHWKIAINEAAVRAGQLLSRIDATEGKAVEAPPRTCEYCGKEVQSPLFCDVHRTGTPDPYCDEECARQHAERVAGEVNVRSGVAGYDELDEG